MLFGLVFVFAIGPSFFLLIQNSIEHEFKKGTLIAIGISLSDISFVTLILVGFSAIISDPDHTVAFSYIGAGILAAFGIYSLVKKAKITNEETIKPGHGLIRFAAKGFLINIFNPAIILFWITLSSTISTTYSYSWQDKRAFFAGMLITMLSADLAKAFLANRIRELITVKGVRLMNRLIGFILIGFGLSLVIKIWFEAS